MDPYENVPNVRLILMMLRTMQSYTNKTVLGYLCEADTVLDFQLDCQAQYPDYQWIVLHRHNKSETLGFIQAFNDEQQLRIRGFVIYGSKFRARDLGLSLDVVEPEIMSHMDQTNYDKLQALIGNKTIPPL